MYKVKRVVIGENKSFVGGEEYLKSKGIEVVVLDDEECRNLMQKFIKEKPEDWYANSSPKMSLVTDVFQLPGMRILVKTSDIALYV